MEAIAVIIFREGLEALLVVGIIIAFLNKSKLTHIKVYVWLALFFGIVIASVLAFALSVFIDGFIGEELQYNLSLMLLFTAIVLLTYMIFWVKNNSNLVEMHKKITLSNNQKLITFLLILTTTLRESLESALFIFALKMDEAVDIQAILTGIGIGLGGAFLLVYLLFKSSLKLPLKEFFKYSSYLLLFIIAGLVSLFIKGMQAYEYLPTLRAPLYDSSFLIANDSLVAKVLSTLVGYDATPSLLQFLGWSFSLLALFLLLRKQNV
jgi:high-affinity iron transporter